MGRWGVLPMQVKLIEHYGSDERVIESARMSTDGAFRSWPEDERLLKYLWEHGHHTPFEMCGATFEIYAPIFVSRQWMRHRSFSYNEMSARYVEMPDEYYSPDIWKEQASKDKQSSAGAVKDQALADIRFKQAIEQARVSYQGLLDLGVSREQARTVLPVSQYTRWRASGNLRNWLHFLSLRCDSHAQDEIRWCAEQVRDNLTVLFPRTMNLWMIST